MKLESVGSVGGGTDFRGYLSMTCASLWHAQAKTNEEESCDYDCCKNCTISTSQFPMHYILPIIGVGLLDCKFSLSQSFVKIDIPTKFGLTAKYLLVNFQEIT